MPPTDERSPLDALGFGLDAQRVYGVVLRNPRTTRDDLTWMSGVGGPRLVRAVESLQDAGLVRLEGEHVVPLPAEDAIARLIIDRAAELQSGRELLEEARRRLPSFVAEHASVGESLEESVIVEVIRGRDLVGLLPALIASAPGELLWMRPDQWRYADGKATDVIVTQLLAEGRASRALYPARALEEAFAAVRTRAEAGEQVRVLATVPTRLAIVGTTLALLPQRFGTSAERVLVIRQEAVVRALRLLFEDLWERALSIPGIEAPVDRDELGERRLVLQQLSSGAKDEQIARTLGVSLRTVRRRVAELMEALGAESRFQAGAEAVRRGWL